MSRFHNAWSWITSTPLRAALIAGVLVVALGAGVAFATVVNGMREREGTAQAPSATASTSSPSRTASSSPRPSATQAPSPTPTPSATVAAAPAVPSATAAPPAPAPSETARAAAAGEPSPAECLDFEFSAAPVTIDSLGELQEGIVGTWVGCRSTPWVPPLPVTVTFRADGTYSARALVSGDDPALHDPAFYYGTDDDSPEKLYALNDLQDGLGTGQIDIVFWEGNINRGELSNVELMGNQLQFEFFHRGEYGPLTYQLYRGDPSG